MAAQVQTSLFEVSPYITGKKRVRYKVPTYTKSYSFYHINPETNEIQYNGDERHIFRIQTLHKLYSLICGYCDINIFESFERKEIILPPLSNSLPRGERGLVVWGEDKQAEIKGSEMLPIKDRVLLHIRLLRNLRKGLSVEETLCQIKKKY